MSLLNREQPVSRGDRWPSQSIEGQAYRRRLIAYGRWQPYVDAELVRQHVPALMAMGLGWERICAIAGVGTGTVEKLLFGAAYHGQGPSNRIRPDAAAKLLAVSMDPALLGATVGVDGTGTRRRLQALVVSGWSMSELARRLGRHEANLGRTIRAPKVRAETERAVRKLYDELWNVDPAESGMRPQSMSLARNHARRLGWTPVGAWDDDTIDDPAACPDWTGRCGTPAGYQAHRQQASNVCGPLP